jgi:phosphate uptake regulator
MFNELKRILQRESLLQQALNDSHKMLGKDWIMFNAAMKSLRESETAEVDIDIDSMDIEINKFERGVRKKVITHLAVNDVADLNIGLVLINIVIDIERIGDYTKNIVTLAENHPGKLIIPFPEWERDVKEVETAISRHFGVLIESMEKSDKSLAESLLDEMWKVKKICSKYVAATLKLDSSDIKVADAVAIALYFRYLKRIAGHLMNIATSVVNPFHKIGYRKQVPVDEP